MTQLFACLLALFFSLGGPAIKGTAKIWHSSLVAKTAPRALTDAEKKLYERASHPKGFWEDVWDRAKAPDGNVYDPSERILKYDEPRELGHKPPQKLSEAKLVAPRKVGLVRRG